MFRHVISDEPVKSVLFLVPASHVSRQNVGGGSQAFLCYTGETVNHHHALHRRCGSGTKWLLMNAHHIISSVKHSIIHSPMTLRSGIRISKEVRRWGKRCRRRLILSAHAIQRHIKAAKHACSMRCISGEVFSSVECEGAEATQRQCGRKEGGSKEKRMKSQVIFPGSARSLICNYLQRDQSVARRSLKNAVSGFLSHHAWTAVWWWRLKGAK